MRFLRRIKNAEKPQQQQVWTKGMQDLILLGEFEVGIGLHDGHVPIEIGHADRSDVQIHSNIKRFCKLQQFACLYRIA